MAQRLISAPYVEVNDVKYAVYGNTVTVDEGHPDIGVTAMSAGGGTVDTLHGVDITTAVGMVKFKLPSTALTADTLSEWKANVGTNVVKVYEGDYEKTMIGASYSEGREMELNASEGGIEITFRGDPISSVA